MSFVANQLKDMRGKNVLHVGADRGNEVVEYSKLGVNHVVWIEANSELIPELIEMLARHESNGLYTQMRNIHHELIGEFDDEVKDFHIYYGPDAQYMSGNKGMSSMLKAKDDWWGSKGHQKTVQLKTVSLDTFCMRNNYAFDHFDLLNLDTQGTELMILRGARSLLKHLRYINVEVTLDPYQYEDNPLASEIYKYLLEYDFHEIGLNLVDNNRWGDALFERRSK